MYIAGAPRFSATFDTIDHIILIEGLASQLVIKGKAFDWFNVTCINTFNPLSPTVQSQTFGS